MNTLTLLRHFRLSSHHWFGLSLLFPQVPPCDAVTNKNKAHGGRCCTAPCWFISRYCHLMLFWEPIWLHSSHHILLKTHHLFRPCKVLVLGATVQDTEPSIAPNGMGSDLHGGSPHWCVNGWMTGHCKGPWGAGMLLKKRSISSVHSPFICSWCNESKRDLPLIGWNERNRA